MVEDDHPQPFSTILIPQPVSLSRCKHQAVMMNQNIIIKALYGPTLHKRLIKIKHEGQDVLG